MKFKNSITLLLALCLLPSLAEAATYWVNPAHTPAGANCNNSPTDPGAVFSSTTIAQGLACLAPGDTLNIKGGTYAESINRSQVPSGTGSGTTYTAPTIIQPASGENVVITGGGTFPVVFSTPGVGITKQYIIFRGNPTSSKNLIFDPGNADTLAAISVGGGALNSGTIQYIRFDGVTVRNVAHSSPVFLGGGDNLAGNNLEFINSTIHDWTALGGTPQNHGIYAASANNLIENNLIYNGQGYGIHLYNSGGASVINNNRITRNIIHDVCQNPGGCNGILIGYGSNNEVSSNLIYNIGLSGADGSGIGAGANASGTLIYNNTIYNTTYYGMNTFGSTGTVIKNNVLQLVNTANGLVAFSNDGSPTYSKNLCPTVQTGCIFGEAASTTFVAPGTDFSLKVGSAAINSGDTNIALGTTIPACSGGTTIRCYNGTAPDIGALETGVPTAGGGPPTLTPNLTSVAAGAEILLTVDDDDINERIEVTGDWVGIFAPGAAVPSGGIIDGIALFDWFYMNGNKTSPPTPISDAVIPFTAPTTPGSYEFRFYRDNSNDEADRLATAPFTVIAPGIVMKFAVSTIKIGPSVTWKIGLP